MSFLLSIEGAIAQGILWSIMTLGVYLTFRLLNFADMTVDGSFATGGAVAAVTVNGGMNPLLSLLLALLAGILCGAITGFLNTKLKIPALLAGILTEIALYSINIRILGGPNVSLLNVGTVFSKVSSTLGCDATVSNLIVGGLFVAVMIAAMYWFFGTEVGCAIRATGNNEYMVRAFGVNTNTMVMIGLMISNGLVSLSGGLVAQSQGYGDVSMGIGTIVVGLASLIIGEVLFGNRFNFVYKLCSIIVGSIIYRIIIALVLNLGLPSSDLKLLTAIIVAIALSVPVIVKKIPGKAAVMNDLDESDRDPDEIASK
ncbi:MAG TPA: ABC transporter permease [Caproicibacter sp.]|nr:ABC transporter permease [Caproicibacter sp.]